MSIHRYEVTDKEWALIEPMIHKHHMGRPQKELRAHFNGILWMARSGARWVDLPERYGPHQTVYSRFCRWRDDGTLERVFQAIHLEGAGELSIDSTSKPRLACSFTLTLLEQLSSLKGGQSAGRPGLWDEKAPRLSRTARSGLHNPAQKEFTGALGV